ncbi:hypothetical protein ACTXT7_001981 [Hymenolepis weldensis]
MLVTKTEFGIRLQFNSSDSKRKRAPKMTDFKFILPQEKDAETKQRKKKRDEAARPILPD